MTSNTDEKMDYQKTLNLPKTDFAMKAGLSQKEPVMLKSWEEKGVYTKIRERSKGKDPFILHDGPPYANGHIHIGHVLNKVLKDVIVKMKSMQGMDAWYVPGWDCHGLPIEHQLLKELKKKKSQVDCVDFRKKAHDYAMKYVDVQREDFKRLGIFGDWEKPYLTLDPQYEYWILKSLATLHKKGYVYRGLKPVNWCYNDETALAEAEVEYEDHTSKSVFVKFAVSNPDFLKGLPDKKLALLIWTTTPWTLLANVAVAVHGAFQYSVVDIGDELLIVEKTLAASVLEKAGVTKFETVKDLGGEELVGLTYQRPFSDRTDWKVVTADYVTKEDGTGLVHTAPGHGQDDFETGLKNDLEVIMPVDDRGVYTKEAAPYEGQHVFKANDKIVEDLKSQGVLFHQEDIQHTYPHCWRCKNPIIFRATQQWFLKIDHENLRTRLKEVIQNDVKWIPPTGQDRIEGMVDGRPDWCLSRQRYWGVPIPALKLKGEQDHELYTEVIDHFAEIVKSEGTDAWFEKDVKDLVPKGFKDGAEFEKTYDILDVWFDSGVSHQAVVKAMMGLELPIDLYLEGSDQHRGWFQSSLIPGICIEDKAPFKEVLTHGFVVDGQGRKMSKSLGNVIKPEDIIKQSGADILRLWVASSSYNEDVRISKEIMARLIDAYRKIRNTFRYLLGNLNGFNPDEHMVEYAQMQEIDRWALHQLYQTISQVQDDFNRFEFAKVYKWIYTFCNEHLSSFYLDILKDRLYTSASNSLERRSAQTALYHILNYLVRVLAPLLCFTAEEVYAASPKSSDTKNVDSVHLLDWLPLPAEWNDKKIEDQFARLVTLRPDVLKALEDKRGTGDIGSSLQAKVILKTSDQETFDYLTTHKEMLPAVFIVSQVELEKISSGDMEIAIEAADGEKCSRCWNYRTDVGQDSAHPHICARCTGVVKEIADGN